MRAETVLRALLQVTTRLTAKTVIGKDVGDEWDNLWRKRDAFQSRLLRYFSRSDRALRVVKLLSPELLRRAAELFRFEQLRMAFWNGVDPLPENENAAALLRAAEELERCTP